MKFEIVDELPEGVSRTPWLNEMMQFMREHPGEWCKGPRTWKGRTASGYVSKLRSLGFEAHSARDDEGESTLYARAPEPAF